jgi:hypothetical protein
MATTRHAYFSATWAAVHGSTVYRRSDGMKVNVTRTHAGKDGRERHPWDERYVGEVIPAEEGRCVEAASVHSVAERA